MGFVKYEQDGFIGVITINRPEALNALLNSRASCTVIVLIAAMSAPAQVRNPLLFRFRSVLRDAGFRRIPE